MSAPTSPVTVTTAGTAQALRVSADYLDTTTGNPLPSRRYCNRCTVQLITTSAVVALGAQPPQGVSSGVTLTSYNILLNAANPAFTIGPYDDGNGVDLGDTWINSDTSGAKVALFPITR